MPKFSDNLLNWYDENPRDLPWKNHNDAYSIWLSEIIMQQTRVSYGQQYYLRFKERFPTVFDLAMADIDEVIKLWEGLGYYSRARNLHATAKQVVEDFNGQFPKDVNELQKLKGIGAYTAGAIASFAYNVPVPAIDGNAYRVFSRYFGVREAIDTSAGKKKFFELGQQLINEQTERAGDFNQAVMNFGALVCKPKRTACMYCDLNKTCFAFQNKLVNELPVKVKKMTMKNRYFLFLIWQYENELLIEERTKNDVWQNLYQFPMIEHDGSKSWERIIAEEKNSNDFFIEKVEQVKQKLTHQQIFGELVYLRQTKAKTQKTNEMWVHRQQLNQYPFPKLLQSAVKKLNLELHIK